MSKKIEFSPALARPLAPEDVRRGDYVAVLGVVGEYISFQCLEEALRQGPVRVLWLPYGEWEPLEVLDVCLPFVLARTYRGRLRRLDVRRQRLARLEASFARRAVKRLADDRKKRKRAGRKKADG